MKEKRTYWEKREELRDEKAESSGLGNTKKKGDNMDFFRCAGID